MPTSTFPAVKAYVVGQMQALEATTLAGVTVTYSDPGTGLFKQHLFFGGTGQDGQSWTALGGQVRDEAYGIKFRVHVEIPGDQTGQQATERAHVIFGVLETSIRTMPTSAYANGLSTGVWDIAASPTAVNESITPEGRACEIDGEITVQARI